MNVGDCSRVQWDLYKWLSIKFFARWIFKTLTDT